MKNLYCYVVIFFALTFNSIILADDIKTLMSKEITEINNFCAKKANSSKKFCSAYRKHMKTHNLSKAEAKTLCENEKNKQLASWGCYLAYMNRNATSYEQLDFALKSCDKKGILDAEKSLGCAFSVGFILSAGNDNSLGEKERNKYQERFCKSKFAASMKICD